MAGQDLTSSDEDRQPSNNACAQSSHHYPSALEQSANSGPSSITDVTIHFSSANVQCPVFIAGTMTLPPWQSLEMSSTIEHRHDKDISSQRQRFSRAFHGLCPGEHQYKFRLGLEGPWVLDEEATIVTDAMGNRNNSITVYEGQDRDRRPGRVGEHQLPTRGKHENVPKAVDEGRKQDGEGEVPQSPPGKDSLSTPGASFPREPRNVDTSERAPSQTVAIVLASGLVGVGLGIAMAKGIELWTTYW